MEQEKEELIKIELKVKASKVKGQTGIIRINEKTIETSEINTGDRVEVSLPDKIGKGIIVDLSTDKYAPGGMVILRSGDMNRLGVKEYDTVVVSQYKKYSDIIVEGMKGGVHKIKERLKTKKEEEEVEEEVPEKK